jgi:hypothetical protein
VQQLLNLQVFLKQGPYGHYVQVGEDKKGLFPKRASLSEVIITLFFSRGFFVLTPILELNCDFTTPSDFVILHLLFQSKD